LGHSKDMKKMTCCEYGPWHWIHNTSSCLLLINGTNKLERYITICWKGLPLCGPLVGLENNEVL
jgi:hypothetical protein